MSLPRPEVCKFLDLGKNEQKKIAEYYTNTYMGYKESFVVFLYHIFLTRYIYPNDTKIVYEKLSEAPASFIRKLLLMEPDSTITIGYDGVTLVLSINILEDVRQTLMQLVQQIEPIGNSNSLSEYLELVINKDFMRLFKEWLNPCKSFLRSSTRRLIENISTTNKSISPLTRSTEQKEVRIVGDIPQKEKVVELNMIRKRGPKIEEVDNPMEPADKQEELLQAKDKVLKEEEEIKKQREYVETLKESDTEEENDLKEEEPQKVEEPIIIAAIPNVPDTPKKEPVVPEKKQPSPNNPVAETYSFSFAEMKPEKQEIAVSMKRSSSNTLRGDISYGTVIGKHIATLEEIRKRRRQQILRQRREEISRQNGDGTFDR